MTKQQAPPSDPGMSDLKSALIEGRRLSIYLRPDHNALGTTAPEYDEAYALPFVFCEGNALAGLTRTGHLLKDKQGRAEAISFSYNTDFPYYSIQYPYRLDQENYQIATKLMSRKHYQIFEFKTREPAHLLFEVHAANGYRQDNYGLSDSIKAGRTHFIVVGLPGSRLWSVPVDISYDYFESGEIEFTTETVLTSKHVVMPQSFHNQLGANNAHVIEAMSHPNADLDLFLPAETTHLKVKADGSFASPSHDQNSRTETYEFLKVFEYP